MKEVTGFIRSTYLPILGAIITTTFRYFSSQGNSYSEFIASVMIGAIIGWLIKVGSEMQEKLERYDERLEDVINLFNYQGDTLRMMLDDRKHNEVIDELIDGALKKNYNKIPFVDINSYFNYLSLALKQSLHILVTSLSISI